MLSGHTTNDRISRVRHRIIIYDNLIQVAEMSHTGARTSDLSYANAGNSGG